MLPEWGGKGEEEEEVEVSERKKGKERERERDSLSSLKDPTQKEGKEGRKRV